MAEDRTITEIMSRLCSKCGSELPSYRKGSDKECNKCKRERLASLIRYEEHKGTHTYHVCPYCKKDPTRRGKCVACLRKELKELDKK